MATIETEFLRTTFESIVGLALKTGQAVPVPTLPSLGDDRLIMSFRWDGDPLIQNSFAGYIPPPGTILLKSSVEITHASINEIKADHNTAGVSATGIAWILASATLSRVTLTLVGFDSGGGPNALMFSQSLGSLPVPEPGNGITIVATALIANDQIVVLRYGTSSDDYVLQSPKNRLLMALSEPDAGSFNWFIHIPSDLFVAFILNRLTAGLTSLMNGTVVEEPPQAAWIQHENGRWGVSANAGVEIIDACPGLFEDVDVSGDVLVSSEFVANISQMRLDIKFTIQTNASDWDAFRCWLGSAGLASLSLGLINPFLGIAAAFSSLVYVGDEVRKAAGEALGSVTVSSFTEVSRSTSSVTYTGTIPIHPLPFSGNITFALDATGLNIRGTIVPIAPIHNTTFDPDKGQLSGTWIGNINCSHRSLQHSFKFQEIVVSDALEALGNKIQELPVYIFLTSVAEPAGKCWIDAWGAQERLPVHIKTAGMKAGDSGFIVLHTSAGLRAYNFGALPQIQSPPTGTQRLIETFCDTFLVPNRLINVVELKWIEPPPDYRGRFDPLRQWQIVITGISRDTIIEVSASSQERKVLASRSDFNVSDTRAVIEMVTNADTDLLLRIPDAQGEVEVTYTTRWILPQHRQVLDGSVNSFFAAEGMLFLRTDFGEHTFDLNLWKITEPRAPHNRSRVIANNGFSMTLKANCIAVIHQGELVIATTLNTLKQEVS